MSTAVTTEAAATDWR